MSLQPPFALFVTTKDIDNDYINTTLTRAWNGAYQAGWDLWILSTINYNHAPKHRNDTELPDGTKAPIPADFTSPFADKTLQDCAKWLSQAPENVALNGKYFAAIDEHSREDDTVLLCRVVVSSSASESAEDEDVDVEYFPVPTDQVQMYIGTSEGSKWDERALNYQRSRMKDGKPDRSQAGPYQ